MILAVILFVCPRDETKTVETKIAELGTGIPYSLSRYLAQQLILGQKVKGQRHRITKCKNLFKAIEYKTVETTVTKLDTGIVHHDSRVLANQSILGQRWRSQSAKHIEGDRLDWRTWVRPMLCTLSNATLYGLIFIENNTCYALGLYLHTKFELYIRQRNTMCICWWYK